MLITQFQHLLFHNVIKKQYTFQKYHIMDNPVYLKVIML